MYLSLVYYPGIELKGFHAFRNKYEPFSSLLPEHLTFVFPVPESIGEEDLTYHILEVLSSWKPFRVHFSNLEKTIDHWLFWTIGEGNELVSRLHDELYTGILAPHLREDLPYSPHIGLGLFSMEDYNFNNPTAELTLDRDKYERARKEFEDMDLDLWFTIDQLTLLRINAEFTACRKIKTFQI